MAKRQTSATQPNTSKPSMHGVRATRRKRKIRAGDPTVPGAGSGNFPNMLYQGGPVINNPQVYVVFLGDWTSSANQTRAGRLSQFVKDLLASSYMNILSQYGCGSTGKLINSIFIANTNTSLTHADLTTILQNAINSTDPATQLPEPGPSQVCIVYLDDNTSVDDTVAGAVLCQTAGDTAFGYHTYFKTTAGNEFYFAIVPGLTDACLNNSCPPGTIGCTLQTTQTQEQRQTAVTSHEFSEMVSDPQIGGTSATSNYAWIDVLDPGDEIGDVCAGTFGTITVGPNTWTVQLMYSKIDDMQTNGTTACVASESFPLPSLLPAVSIILDRSTFGKDEVNAMLNAGGANFPDAVYVVVNGFTPDELGLTASNLYAPPNTPTFGGSFAALGDPAISFDATTGVQLTQPGQFWDIQTITYPFSIKFTTLNAFNNLSTTNASATYGLTATIANTVTPFSYPALSATSSIAELELVFQADPFMTAGETWWLSNDIRVFPVTPATLPSSKIPLQYSTTQYTSDANTYIKALINELNTNFTDPSTPNTPFNGISPLEQQSAINLSGQDSSGHPVFDFALARVHLRGDTASDVRVFFRLFISTSPDTNFDINTTFRSQVQTDTTDAAIPGTLIPMLGFPSSDMSSTIPFFAEPRIDGTMWPMTHQSDPPNVQTIPSPLIATPPAPGAEVYAYFGCWLDLNQATPRFPSNPSTQPHPDGPYGQSAMLSIPQLIMSNHACIVAQIAYDQDPIPPGANAATSDKIGQRNLAWSGSGNPDPADGHRVPTPFDLRPTSADIPSVELPDELMIDWGDTPAGSVATIYWPQIDAGAVINLARRHYASVLLRQKDAHTVQCATGQVTYIPIPASTGPHLAGLLTVDLPLGVKVGQQFDIVVRRLTSRLAPSDGIRERTGIGWRYTVGAFQIRIPVSTGRHLLAPEESLLAVFKWKLQTLPQNNRWHPVLNRYIQVISARVDAFGGNAADVKPSLQGYPGLLPPPSIKPQPQKHIEATGKIANLVYDAFGDFDGFTLIDEGGSEHRYSSQEIEIERLVKSAWIERTLISVTSEPDHPERLLSIILRRTPKPI